MRSKVCFSSLYEYPSLKQYLVDCHHLSNQKIKKIAEETNLSKKFIQQKIVAQREYELPIAFLNDGLINPIYQGELIDILFENNKWMAISKPARCHSHPLGYDDTLNVMSFLRSRGKREVLAVNDTQYDRGLLYRIDFETSGLLLMAKNNEIYQEIRKNFHQITKKKIYLAVVEGEALKEECLRHQLSQSGKVIKVDPSGKEASLEYIRVAYNKDKNYSLLAISLHTGLRHQIRVQLSSVGMAIVGDLLYGDREADRLYLHAYHYHIQTENELVSATCEWPELIESFGDLDSRFKMISNKFQIS